MTQLTNDAHPAAQGAPAPSRAWLVAGMLFAFMVLNFADKATLGFAGVQIQEDLGIGPGQYGLVQSAFFWLFAVGAITVGALASKVSMRWLLAALMLIWIVTMLPLTMPVGFGVLLACRVALGFAEGPAYALATHTVHNWFPPEKRALPAGLVTAGASCGPLIAAPVLTWVIATWSWHAAFGVLVVCGALWIVIWLAIPTGTPPAVLGGTVRGPLPTDAPLRTLLSTGTVAGIGLLTFFSYWSTTLKVSWLPVYLNDGLGYDTITSGRLITLPYAFAAAGAISAGLLSNHLTARGVSRRIARGWLAGGLVVGSGLSMVGFTVVDPGWVQMALVVAAFSLNSAAYAVAFTAVGDVVHPKRRGTVLGVLVAFYSTAGILAPLLLGHFVGGAADRLDGYNLGFAVTGVLMAVGGLVATAFVRPERDLVRLAARSDASTEVAR